MEDRFSNGVLLLRRLDDLRSGFRRPFRDGCHEAEMSFGIEGLEMLQRIVGHCVARVSGSCIAQIRAAQARDK